MDRETDYARTPLERFVLRNLVDPRLNYGREIVAHYLSIVSPFSAALDLGAGEGKDLEAARSLCPAVRAIAVEGYPLTPSSSKAEGSRSIDSILNMIASLSMTNLLK